jgi:PAS domain S-box-containing protein
MRMQDVSHPSTLAYISDYQQSDQVELDVSWVEAPGIGQVANAPAGTDDHRLTDGEAISAAFRATIDTNHWTSTDGRLVGAPASSMPREAASRSGAGAAAGDAARVGWLRLAADGTIREADATFCSLLGHPHEDVIGARLERFVHAAEQRSDRHARFGRALALGSAAACEIRCLRRDGREVALAITLLPDPVSGDGAERGLVGSVVDVTAESRAWSETRSRLAAMDQQHCVATFDLDGTILDANANFLAATGYGR